MCICLLRATKINRSFPRLPRQFLVKKQSQDQSGGFSPKQARPLTLSIISIHRTPCKFRPSKREFEELGNKRQKKVAIDCNQVFADIARIKAA
jgi:hypothetical protein